eukprot:Amastigsp_a852946_4.p2 type:complete len:169 gc:universal Amastigsp_a852946_4:801-295(-)
MLLCCGPIGSPKHERVGPAPVCAEPVDGQAALERPLFERGVAGKAPHREPHEMQPEALQHKGPPAEIRVEDRARSASDKTARDAGGYLVDSELVGERRQAAREPDPKVSILPEDGLIAEIAEGPARAADRKQRAHIKKAQHMKNELDRQTLEEIDAVAQPLDLRLEFA